jgi:hypothetical protein
LYIGVIMLVPKLLRLDDATIQEVEELAQKLSEKEYTSFSALVRKLIRNGMDDMKTRSSPIGGVKMNIVKDQDLNQVLWAIFAKKYQQGSNFKCLHLDDFKESYRRGIEEVFFFLDDKGLVKFFDDVNSYRTIYSFKFEELQKLALSNFIDKYPVKDILERITSICSNPGYNMFHADEAINFRLGISNTCNINKCIGDKCPNHSYDDAIRSLADCGVLIDGCSIRTNVHQFNDFGHGQPSIYIRHILGVNNLDTRMYNDMLSFPQSLI